MVRYGLLHLLTLNVCLGSGTFVQPRSDDLYVGRGLNCCVWFDILWPLSSPCQMPKAPGEPGPSLLFAQTPTSTSQHAIRPPRWPRLAEGWVLTAPATGGHPSTQGSLGYPWGCSQSCQWSRCWQQSPHGYSSTLHPMFSPSHLQTGSGQYAPEFTICTLWFWFSPTPTPPPRLPCC